jgi:PPOX class probable F420-dependent enzyme
MRHDLSPEDLDDLLERPLLAILATRRKDGSALLSPVWHEWRDGAFLVPVEAGDGKLVHIARDPLVSIVVAEHEPPYRGLEITAPVEILDGQYGPVNLRIGRRYIGDAVDRSWSDDSPGVVLRIAPGRLRGWDFKDDYPEDPAPS